jgi:ActR/RegA family two-component response regulator
MPASLHGRLVLVVEDEALIALDIAQGFKAAGADVVISRTLEDAMKKAELPNLTAAVIDHALHNGLTTSDVHAYAVSSGKLDRAAFRGSAFSS